MYYLCYIKRNKLKQHNIMTKLKTVLRTLAIIISLSIVTFSVIHVVSAFNNRNEIIICK